MKPAPHWSPRYIVDRVQVEVQTRRSPGDPWWTHAAVTALGTLLRSDDRCLEWGSGRSTVWLASRVGAVDSVEHDPSWFARVESMLEPHENATVHLAAADAKSYVAAVDLERHGGLTVAVVDGIHRAECILAVAPRLQSGGLLILDNAERYLPNESRSPESVGNSYEGPRWREVETELAPWRRLWTSNGVWDTAIFFKP